MGPSVGWNSLLIELFRPQLCSNGSRRGWIRLLPAVLNWNFGGATDLFNFQCGMVEMGWSFFDSLLNTGLLRGKRHERDSQVPCKAPSRPNPTTRKGWPHHRGVRPLPFSNSGVGSFRKSDHLQMSLQRQHLLLSYLKTLSVGQAGVWVITSHSADRCSSTWSHHVVVQTLHHERSLTYHGCFTASYYFYWKSCESSFSETTEKNNF